jgi:hypothetical protein
VIANDTVGLATFVQRSAALRGPRVPPNPPLLLTGRAAAPPCCAQRRGSTTRSRAAGRSAASAVPRLARPEAPSRTPSLDDDVEAMGLAWEDRGGGYWRVTGGLFVLHVVEIDRVGPTEGDDLLHSLGNGRPVTPEALWFWAELVGSKEAGMSMQDMEGYDEVVQKFLATLSPEQRVAGLAPEQVLSQYPAEQRVAGLPAEQRLAGLDREHQALALPVEVLRLLPDEYLRSLPPEVQAEIRRRLG